MFSYLAYGLTICSQLSIPEFISKEVINPDVTITVQQELNIADYIPKDAIAKFWCLKIGQQQSTFYVRDAGVFLIENGDRVIFIPTENPCKELIRISLIETVMAIVLQQRGLLVLHGSGININGNGVVFVGKSGQGKSSTAGALHRYGYEIITDDVAPINLTHKEPTIAPGFPQLKLGEEIAAELGHDFATLPIFYPSEAKRCYRPKQNFSLALLPLKRIYILTDASEFEIEALRPSEAVFELSCNSRPTSLSYIRDKEHFLRCVAFAQKFTIHRLKRPRNLQLLPQLVKTVEEDLARELQIFVTN